MDNGMSVADVAALSGGGGFGGWGNGFEGLIYLAVIASMFGGGFGWGNNGSFRNAIGYENLATSSEVQRGFDNQNLQAQTRDILSAVNAGTAQSVAATNQTFHDSLAATQNFYNELARDIASLSVGQAQALANQNACCCDTKMLIQQTAANTDAQIAQSRYDNAIALAGLEQRLTSKMDQNEITSLRDQIQQLQLAQATAGMLKFPQSWSYGAGPFPPIYGSCCGSI